MKKKPLVSIIIPYYKKIKFFPKTLNSILKQDYQNYEIIIIYDDLNRDDLKILKKITKNIKKKVRFLINKNNLGAGKSRNKGIEISRGSYLSFIDSDDIWSGNKLSTQIAFMQKHNCAVSFTAYEIVDENFKIVKKIGADKVLTYKDFIKSCRIGLSTVMVKKRNLSNLRFSSYKTQEDYSLWLKLSKKHNFYGINRYLCKWTKLGDSLSSDSIQKISDAFKIYNGQEKLNFLNSIYRVIILTYYKLKKNFNN